MPETRITRREFLKLVGVGSVAVGLNFMGISGLFTPRRSEGITSTVPESTVVASASDSDSWTRGPDTLTTAIHAALLQNGKILYIGGSANDSHQETGPYKAALLEPTSGNQTEYDMPEDLFCGGHVQLLDGNILIAGGTLAYFSSTTDNQWRGLKSAYVFHVPSSSFMRVSSMAHGRWYPSLVTFGNASVVAVSGLDELGCTNGLSEIYDPVTKSWTKKFDPASNRKYCVGQCSKDSDAGKICYGDTNNGTNPPLSMYPRMHMLPSGIIAVCGQFMALWTWWPHNGRWNAAGQMAYGKNRYYGTSVLLPLQNTTDEKGKILVAGGSPTPLEAATNHCEILEMVETVKLKPRVVSVMKYARRLLTPVILPDGKVMMIGGTSIMNDPDHAVYEPEMFDPLTEEWTTLPAASIPRLYHSVALLLPSGKVWTASGSHPPYQLTTETFSPWYMSKSRPINSNAPMGGAYGDKIIISTPSADSINSVSLVRLSTVTHHFNTDQRLIWLQIISKTSSSITVKAPLNSWIAPQGYYLLHILNGDGVPSWGKMIKIPGKKIA